MSVEIIDHGWDKLKLTWEELSHAYTKVGLPEEGEPAEVAEAHVGNMADLVQIAAIHEFGAPKRNIPERSFIRSTYDEQKEKLREIITKEYNGVIFEKTSPRKALSRIGEWLTAKTKLKIKKRIPPALKPATIISKTVGGKKGDVPLIDTGQLIQSIQHVEVMG
jgi:hypothetical protein